MGLCYANDALVRSYPKATEYPSDKTPNSGARFRKHRRLSQALLNPNAARGYTEMHEKIAATLLSSLAKRPELFYDHILV